VFFDALAFERGKALFERKARCAACHVPPSTRNSATTSTRPRRSAWTHSRRIVRRPTRTARPRSAVSGRT